MKNSANQRINKYRTNDSIVSSSENITIYQSTPLFKIEMGNFEEIDLTENTEVIPNGDSDCIAICKTQQKVFKTSGRRLAKINITNRDIKLMLLGGAIVALILSCLWLWSQLHAASSDPGTRSRDASSNGMFETGSTAKHTQQYNTVNLFRLPAEAFVPLADKTVDAFKQRVGANGRMLWHKPSGKVCDIFFQGDN